jgi:hypothetical protein
LIFSPGDVGWGLSQLPIRFSEAALQGGLLLYVMSDHSGPRNRERDQRGTAAGGWLLGAAHEHLGFGIV